MRIWSLHPKYLDSKGLVALWRETLLAQAVLAGKTQGYKNHPQLNRFKASKKPLESIGFYLLEIHAEALRRDYRFDSTKILTQPKVKPILTVTQGQLDFEWEHLRQKLQNRDPAYLRNLDDLGEIKPLKPHLLFKVIAGEIEDWERV